MSTISTTNTIASNVPRIGLIDYPRPEWTDRQRAAHTAALAIATAAHELLEAFYAGTLSSQEPYYRAWLAWVELEREIAPLFAKTEEKEH